MTVVAFASVKGAPGVTTTACLVGAVWPVDRRVVVAECDPAGGDLAARFSLPSSRGWPTFVNAVRRGGPAVSLEPHLQQLPGGLEVLIGSRATRVGDPDRALSLLAGAGWGPGGSSGDLIVDFGRIHPAWFARSGWSGHVDVVALVVRGDAASALRVRDLAESPEGTTTPLALVVIGRGRYSGTEIGRFVGIPVLGELPFDPGAAAVASGERGGARRLARSALVTAAGRVASALVGTPAPGETVAGPAGPSVAPAHTDGRSGDPEAALADKAAAPAHTDASGGAAASSGGTEAAPGRPGRPGPRPRWWPRPKRAGGPGATASATPAADPDVPLAGPPGPTWDGADRRQGEEVLR